MRTLALLLLCLAMSLVGCKSKQAADEPPPLLQHTQQRPEEDDATISGVVKFEGTVPKPQKIDKSQDPACSNAPAFDESLVVNNGDLANVFVYVKAGLRINGFGVGGIPPTIEQ